MSLSAEVDERRSEHGPGALWRRKAGGVDHGGLRIFIVYPLLNTDWQFDLMQFKSRATLSCRWDGGLVC